MMTIPNEIFAWLDVPKSKTDLPKGGWNTYSDMKNIRFVRADLAQAPAPVRVTDEADARFAEWFRKNYPGPDTIIHKPDWHAPKILRAAVAALEAPDAGVVAELVEALRFYADKAAWAEGPVETVETVIGTAYRNKAAEIQKDRGNRARRALALIAHNTTEG